MQHNLQHAAQNPAAAAATAAAAAGQNPAPEQQTAADSTLMVLRQMSPYRPNATITSQRTEDHQRPSTTAAWEYGVDKDQVRIQII